jgi:thioredoxin-dependent peroxiredoxin
MDNGHASSFHLETQPETAMSKLLLALTAVVLVVVGALAIRGFAAADVVPQAGQTASTFTLPNQEGQPVSLDSYKGKWVVLYFYPRDMTSGCTREAHEFQNDLEKYKTVNAVILGVSVDSVDSHKQFCTKDSLTFSLLSDSDKKVVTAYGSLGNFGVVQIAKRNTFLIDPSGKIAKAWTGVDPAHSSDTVLAALAELQKH